MTYKDYELDFLKKLASKKYQLEIQLQNKSNGAGSKAIDPHKIKLLNKSPLCKETKLIRKPIYYLCNKVINQIDDLGNATQLDKLASIYNISTLIMSCIGHYRVARILCTTQLNCFKKRAHCYGYNNQCIYYYHPIINIINLNLLLGKTNIGLVKFKKLLKLYLSYINNTLHPKLKDVFMQDNQIINIIAKVSLKGLFQCLIKLGKYGEILQYENMPVLGAEVNNLINDCIATTHLLLGNTNSASECIEKNKSSQMLVIFMHLFLEKLSIISLHQIFRQA